MEWHIKQELSRVGEENEHMLRCRAKEEWICNTGGLFPHLPKANDGEPDETDPDLLWAVGGMEGQGQRGFAGGAGGPATASIKIEIAWVVHKKNDRAQGRHDAVVGRRGGEVEQSCEHPGPGDD